MIKAGIVGASGYAGVELVRLLLSHPQVELARLTSVSFMGKKISEVYPSLLGICDDTLVSQEESFDGCDVVFAALPHGMAEPIAKRCMEAGALFIDIGADFRLEEESVYQKAYGLPYNEKELHRQAVYGLPELFREKIRGARIIGNPGCYPTSVALGLAPAVENGLIDTATLIVDAKSGVTGAGRGLTQNTHFPDCNESFAPYKAGQHRHTPEIEQTLSLLAGQPVKITFVPHLLPINRGILSTMYASLAQNISLAEIHALYRKRYENERFVRVLALGEYANLKNVRCSNYCDISLHLDEHTNRLIAAAAIDNMVKGAAGQAVQNMNIALGLPENMGLGLIPPAF